MTASAETYCAAMFIDGREVTDTSAPRVPVHNPANEELLGTAPTAGATEVAATVQAAQAAFLQWRRTPPLERAAKLRRIAVLMRERVESIARLLTLEIGKPLAESRIEVEAGAEYFDWCAEEARRTSGSSRAGRAPDSRFQVSYEPVGVVLALTAWNYPVILASRKLAMAIAAGCSVILRPADEGPASVTELVRCCIDAGLPRGTVNLLFGTPERVVDPLMENPLVRKVSFTGSTRVGQLLIRKSAACVKRITMELGGHAPFIVLEDADVEKAASAAAFGKFRNAGQVCTSPSRFFVHESVAADFTQRFGQLAAAIRVGNGLDKDVQMGPLATPRQRERAETLVADALAKGAKLRSGGGRAKAFNRGYFFEPTVLDEIPGDARILAEEPFCPVAAIVAVPSARAAIEQANALEFGLAAYVFTRSRSSMDTLAAELESGVIGCNSVAVALPEAPFGGVKQSGYGREGGEDCLLDYLNPKFVHSMPG
jgi:succinate-semialdehyde dehydrogenase/glutarate-semialdehyde dehydrogenase